MRGVSHQYSDETKSHIGCILPGEKIVREVYRIQFSDDHVFVYDMLDEGGWFAPTIEQVPVTILDYKTIIAALIKKYEAKLRKE